MLPSAIDIIIDDIRDAIEYRWGRLLCRALRIHGPGCRGRNDHFTPGMGLIDPARWVR